MQNEGKGKVLIMDDEVVMREMIGILLEVLGYSVTAAHNGEEALSLFRRANEEGNPFNAAILDLFIPEGMSGRETAAELRELNPAMPILALSGYPDDPAMVEPQAYKFTDSIAKPFKSAQLVSKLEYHLAKA